MVQAYLRSMSRGAKSSRREYLTALRRETAKYGRNPDLVEFDCFFLCTSCGRLSEPSAGDPMRTEAPSGSRGCATCGAPGLADLRQTPLVHSLCDLEKSDVSPSGRWWVAMVAGLLSAIGAVVWLGAALRERTIDGFEACFLILLISVVISLLLARMVPLLRRSARRSLPRRWRMPRVGKRVGATPRRRVRGHAQTTVDLLRAPLSGRPCVAYEVAVRDDADPSGGWSSWRLIEQDNVGFCVGGLEIAPGEALLQVRRELIARGTIGSKDDATRRYLRMRGLLDSEDVYIYETIVAPGEACTASRRSGSAPVVVSH